MITVSARSTPTIAYFLLLQESLRKRQTGVKMFRFHTQNTLDKSTLKNHNLSIEAKIAIYNQKDKNLKVAVIDDEVDLREVIRDTLTMDGYEVVEADNGKTGLELIKTEYPDLIICDARMPEMNGDELFKEVRKLDSKYGIIPFIFLSGDASKQDVISRLNLGADNCLQKPIALSLLSAHVNAHRSFAKRVSTFVTEQLDTIAKSLHCSVEHNFDGYESLFPSVNNYVEAILALTQQFSFDRQPAELNDSEKSGHAQRNLTAAVNTNISHLEYVDFFLNEYQQRRKLVKTTNGEDLSWLLIYLVVRAHIKGEKIPVSDLYVSAQSAKTTTYARINTLVEDGIFQKFTDSSDGRRQIMSLTDRFRDTLLMHIDANINLIAKQSA